MNTVLLWVLITVPGGSNGTVQLLGHFSKLEHCQQLRQNLPVGSYQSRCIQTQFYAPKQ